MLAVGNPFSFNQTVTLGIVSAVNRHDPQLATYNDFIQTDAAINPGNSGGALVNSRGELVGINTMIYSQTGGYQGLGFAVPANLARADHGAAEDEPRRSCGARSASSTCARWTRRSPSATRSSGAPPAC